MIPFDTYDVPYRDKCDENVLVPLCARVERMGGAEAGVARRSRRPVHREPLRSGPAPLIEPQTATMTTASAPVT